MGSSYTPPNRMNSDAPAPAVAKPAEAPKTLEPDDKAIGRLVREWAGDLPGECSASWLIDRVINDWSRSVFVVFLKSAHGRSSHSRPIKDASEATIRAALDDIRKTEIDPQAAA